MSDFGSKLFGSKLKYGLGVALLLSVALTAWGVSFQLTDSKGTLVTCPAATDVVVNASTGDISANVNCNLSGTSTPPPSGSFTLTVNTNGGTGTGTVSCNSTSCATSYTAGTTVNLVATGTGGSTFTSWGGDCSSSGFSSTCSLTMDTSHTVTAAFAAPVSTGGDPGAGTNPWINGATYTHNRGALADLYVPRCIPSQYPGCRNGGSQSAYDMVRAGQTWAMRIPYGMTTSTSTFGYSLARSETGESLTVYDMALSTIPNDFDVANPSCKKSNVSGATIAVHDATAVPNPPSWLVSCPLTRNTNYYLNVRPAAGTSAATSCGSSGANACRYKIILPNPPAGFYTN